VLACQDGGLVVVDEVPQHGRVLQRAIRCLREGVVHQAAGERSLVELQLRFAQLPEDVKEDVCQCKLVGADLVDRAAVGQLRRVGIAQRELVGEGLQRVVVGG
jgi:hypothetical protein